ncbi:43666_t:CDS:2 [Gigaspora margarita]|uniref:43666_t:CDS:1 n=1 Tax=Gigaspora margarita TaxID=4874 RepID=A0ABM8W5A6_GIGMA|nr:43666_t:CDS:2 [Gigaspora margarita]
MFKLHWLLFYFITCLIFFAKSSEDTYNIVASRTYGQANYFPLDKVYSYDDGTLLTGTLNKSALVKYYSDIHILFTNGSISTISLSNIKHQENWTVFQYNILEPNFIFLLYQQSNDVLTNLSWSIIDWSGNVLLDNVFIGQIDENNIGIISNIRPEIGFLVVQTNYTFLKWTKYSSPSNGNISIISEGYISFPSGAKAYTYTYLSSFFTLLPFQRVDGGYGVAYCLVRNNKLSRQNDQTNVNPAVLVYVAFIPNSNESDVINPFKIYETRNISNVVMLGSCHSRQDAQGNDCLIHEVTRTGDRSLPTPRVTIVAFPSTGSMTNATQVLIPQTVPNQSPVLYNYFPLYYGGFLVIKFYLASNDTVGVSGYLSDDQLSTFDLWKMPNPLTLNIMDVYERFSLGLLQNNTFWIAVQGLNWTIYSLDLPHYHNNCIFQNVLIISSFPVNNQTISLRFTDSFNITYRNPILQSSGNLSIYQLYNNDTLLRQTYSGSYCSVLNNKVTISCGILSSTFNVPNSSYLITIGNGFVKDLNSQEQIRGISNRSWIIKTVQQNLPNIYGESIAGTLRLSEEGTIYYNNLTHDQQSLFRARLSEELAQSIPIDSSRLSFGRVNFDPDTPKHQSLFELNIFGTKDLFRPNIDQIVNDLNVLIKNKYITVLSKFPHTNYIDETYSFTPNYVNVDNNLVDDNDVVTVNHYADNNGDEYANKNDNKVANDCDIVAQNSDFIMLKIRTNDNNNTINDEVENTLENDIDINDEIENNKINEIRNTEVEINIWGRK